MDIVLLAQDVTWGGSAGDAVHLRALARNLARRGHAIRVIARPSGAGTAPVDGVDLHLLPSSWNLGIALARSALASRALLGVVSDRRPDVVYSRSFGDIAEASLTAAVGCPLVFEVNGDAIAERESQRGRPLPRLVRSWAVRRARRGFRVARLVVAITETLQRRLAEEFRVPPAKLRLIPNAADPALFRPLDTAACRAALDLPRSSPMILFVGNLAPWQGVEVLVRAFAQMQRRRPDALLVVVGEGLARSGLEALAKELDVRERVRFAGAVPHEEVPRYISAADVCVAPMTRERARSGSSAIKVHEYLACGRAVVASRIQGLEFLEAEGLGKLVPPEDPTALAAAVNGAVEDASWRVSVALKARAWVLEKRGWKAVAEAVEDVCRTAAST